MATYRISGVWKDTNNAITHYALHLVGSSTIGRGEKTTKAETIRLLKVQGNSAVTCMWDYNTARWRPGETIEVVDDRSGKYLRTDPNSRLTDNLAHLIDYDWLAP